VAPNSGTREVGLYFGKDDDAAQGC